jgi:hypothetical protein
VATQKSFDPASVHSHLQRLSSAAQTLNELSDELTKQVAHVETAINRLVLGVNASVVFNTVVDEEGTWEERWRLAYGKEEGRWGILIERILESGGVERWDSWRFKDAPREQRIRAVDSIPELIEALVMQSDAFASKITEKVELAKRIAATVNQPRKVGTEK